MAHIGWQNPNAPRFGAFRTISSLVMREMATTYGRSALGYFWAIAEPVAAIILLSVFFSLYQRHPRIGTSFPLFYASGVLPYMVYAALAGKLATAIRYSSNLLAYSRVTFMDALLARLIVSGLTGTLVFGLVLASVIWIYDLQLIIDYTEILKALVLIFVLAFGIGTMNCFIGNVLPIWNTIWSVVTRPLGLISGVIFIFDEVPREIQTYLWYNPLIHIIGQMRMGIYSTYEGWYVQPLYPLGLGLALSALGIVLLRRFRSDIMNDD